MTTSDVARAPMTAMAAAMRVLANILSVESDAFELEFETRIGVVGGSDNEERYRRFYPHRPLSLASNRRRNFEEKNCEIEDMVRAWLGLSRITADLQSADSVAVTSEETCRWKLLLQIVKVGIREFGKTSAPQR